MKENIGMIVKKKGNITFRNFDSITELVEYTRKGEVKECFKEAQSSVNGGYYFTKTNSYEEAEEMLLHGWEEMATKINTKLKSMNVSKQTKQRTVYDVCGYQCSVPRYLQGVPTNMINKQTVKQKQKVINICKSIVYSAKIDADVILNESVKILHCINTLEKQGYRVNLNIIIYCLKRNTHNVCTIKIKDASQKLNVKQIAFPLVHPSMLRRIFFRVEEIAEEYGSSFVLGYGIPGDVLNNEAIKEELKGSYYFPSFVNEKEITDIEKYRI